MKKLFLALMAASCCFSSLHAEDPPSNPFDQIGDAGIDEIMEGTVGLIFMGLGQLFEEVDEDLLASLDREALMEEEDFTDLGFILADFIGEAIEALEEVTQEDVMMYSIALEEYLTEGKLLLQRLAQEEPSYAFYSALFQGYITMIEQLNDPIFIQEAIETILPKLQELKIGLEDRLYIIRADKDPETWPQGLRLLFAFLEEADFDLDY